MRTVSAIQARIAASFGVALLVITTGWISSGALSSAMGVRDQARRSRDIGEASDAIVRNILEAESAQRGYLLTQSPDYLAAYERASENQEPLKSLRSRLDNSSLGAKKVEALENDIDAKRKEMALVIETSRTQGIEAALALVGRGKVIMDDLRHQLDVIYGDEARAREVYRATITKRLMIARMVVLGGTLLAFALAVLVNTSLVRIVRDRELVQATVEDQGLKLQKQNEVLLVHERQLGEQLARQRELSSALQRSNEELDQFAYATSHDLRAPLRGIMNLAAWVEEDLGPSATAVVKQNLVLLHGRARRLDSLVEGILAYSRAGRVREQVTEVSTETLLREVIELIAPPSEVQIVLQPPLPTLRTERVPLQQVFMNLINNAIKHGSPQGKGRIEISATEENGSFTFSITDHGPGIAEQYQTRIFALFQMLSSRDQVEGAGIGLAVVKKIIESRGGSIRVHSAVGEGARFVFTWPLEVA